jgi:hypothetical protein
LPGVPLAIAIVDPVVERHDVGPVKSVTITPPDTPAAPV